MNAPMRRVRWTAAAISKAIALPKPEGEIAKVHRSEGGNTSRDLSSLERRLLRELISKADLLEPATKDEFGNAERWLLIPAHKWVIDLMAVFEVEREDLEDGADRELDIEREEIEDGADRELDIEREEIDEREPDHDEGRNWTENIDQSSFLTMGVGGREDADEEPDVTFADRMGRPGLKDGEQHPTKEQHRARFKARRDDGSLRYWHDNGDRSRLLAKLPKRNHQPPRSGRGEDSRGRQP